MKPTKSKNSKQRSKAIKHEQDAIELRILGYSYRKIGKALGISDAGAYKAVARAIAKQEIAITESAREVMKLELDRIDELMPNAIERAKAGSDKAVNSVIRLMDRRSRYLGLDAAVKVEDIAEREKVILKLSERLDITIEEARAEYRKTKEGY